MNTGKCYNISHFKDNGLYIDLNKQYKVQNPEVGKFTVCEFVNGASPYDVIHYISNRSIEHPDSIVSSVIESFKSRASIGKKKYGKTLDRNDLNIGEWLQHLQEELMDATLYIQKLKTLV